MQRPTQLLSAAYLALMCCAVAVPCLPAEPQTPVLAQDLKKLRAPGKVASVLWTRRTDQYTLQIVFPRSYRMPAVDAQRKPVSAATNPSIQAWLLKADGTVIPASRRSVSISGQTQGNPPDEVLYSIPLPAGREAVAVALMIDNDYYIEQLQPFSNQKT